MTGDGLAEMQALLGRVALFRDAGQADIKALAAMCDRRAHAAGEVAFLDGVQRYGPTCGPPAIYRVGNSPPKPVHVVTHPSDLE